jgi:nitrate/TMAO reductase-like tetraheme cytochrome c subunit
MPSLAPRAIAFAAALLALVFLLGAVFLWDAPDSPRRHWVLLFAVALVPGLALVLGFGQTLDVMKQPVFCGSCHVMDPFIADLKDPASETLAAKHYKNRYIREDQCYTCHSDYGVFGPLRAKLAGVRHLVNYETGNYVEPIKIREPYRIANCLHCHGEAQNFQTAHADTLPLLESGDMSCLDCHRPAHPEGRVSR